MNELCSCINIFNDDEICDFLEMKGKYHFQSCLIIDNLDFPKVYELYKITFYLDFVRTYIKNLLEFQEAPDGKVKRPSDVSDKSYNSDEMTTTLSPIKP